MCAISLQDYRNNEHPFGDSYNFNHCISKISMCHRFLRRHRGSEVFRNSIHVIGQQLFDSLLRIGTDDEADVTFQIRPVNDFGIGERRRIRLFEPG